MDAKIEKTNLLRFEDNNRNNKKYEVKTKKILAFVGQIDKILNRGVK